MNSDNKKVNSIIDRIESDLGMSGLAHILATKLEPSDFQSLLLEVYQIRAKLKTPSQVLAEYQNNRFSKPSKVLPSLFIEWEKVALSSLPKSFEFMELSPVCPLGTCSVVADVTQNWSISTSRNTEVVSDPTNVLALEAATRRRNLLKQDQKSKAPVHLATSHRVIRAQKFSDPLSVPHFRLFALCSAGRNYENFDFEIESLIIHIRFYLNALQTYLGIVPMRLEYSYFGSAPSCVEKIKSAMSYVAADYKSVESIFDPDRKSGRSYYQGYCFHIDIQVKDKFINLVDGGIVDWIQKLLSNDKEKLLISGIGTERLCALRGELGLLN